MSFSKTYKGKAWEEKMMLTLQLVKEGSSFFMAGSLAYMNLMFR